MPVTSEVNEEEQWFTIELNSPLQFLLMISEAYKEGLISKSELTFFFTSFLTKNNE